MAIDQNTVKHLAGLARIDVSPAEQEVLTRDLESILGYVSQIKEAVAELGTPEAGVLRNVLRDDVNPHEAGLHTEDMLKAAPRRDGNLLVVKKIL